MSRQFDGEKQQAQEREVAEKAAMAHGPILGGRPMLNREREHMEHLRVLCISKAMELATPGTPASQVVKDAETILAFVTGTGNDLTRLQERIIKATLQN